MTPPSRPRVEERLLSGSLPKSLHVGGIEGQDQVVVHLYRIFQCDDGRAGTSVRERALFITAWSAVSMSRLSLVRRLAALRRDRRSPGGVVLRTFSNFSPPWQNRA